MLRLRLRERDQFTPSYLYEISFDPEARDVVRGFSKFITRIWCMDYFLME